MQVSELLATTPSFTAEGPGGAVAVLPARGRIVVTRVEGHLDAVLARALERGMHEQLGPQPVELWHEWDRMTGYESAARAALTGWAVRHRRRVAEMTFLTDHVLIRMGVATASAALALVGLKLNVYRARVDWERALAESLRSARE